MGCPQGRGLDGVWGGWAGEENHRHRANRGAGSYCRLPESQPAEKLHFKKYFLKYPPFLPSSAAAPSKLLWILFKVLPLLSHPDPARSSSPEGQEQKGQDRRSHATGTGCGEPGVRVRGTGGPGVRAAGVRAGEAAGGQRGGRDAASLEEGRVPAPVRPPASGAQRAASRRERPGTQSLRDAGTQPGFNT